MAGADTVSVGVNEAAPVDYQSADLRDKILTRVRDRRTKWSKGREALLGNAYLNILYERGHQWVVYDARQGRVRPADVPAGTPRPVTNKFAETMRAYTSILSRVEPDLTFAPATDDPEDRATADVADRAIQVIEQECDIRLVRQQLAVTSAYCSTAWLETGYDPDPRWGERKIPMDECLACGNVQPPNPAGCQGTDPATGQPCGSKLQMPAMDPTGQPITTSVPIGKMYARVRSIFELLYDQSIKSWKDHRELIDDTAMSDDEAKRRWPAFKDDITPNTVSGPGEWYLGTLEALAGARNEVGRGVMTAPFGRTVTGPANRVTETRYWCLPEPDFPEGLLAVVVGKELLVHAGPLPYQLRTADGSEIPFLPFIEFPQQLMPLSAMSKTVADDLRAKQTQRNRWESLLELIAMRTANPIWLLPNGVVIDAITGVPGQTVRYNALGPTPAKPERIPGQGIPAGILGFMQMIDHDFETLAATYDIAKGARPPGVSSGVQMQILTERSQSRFGSMFIQWENAWCQWASQAIEIFRQFVTEPRLLRIQGKNGKWQVEKFLGSDLQGRLDITAEAGSAMPQTTLTQRAEMEQMFNLGLISPQDPETRMKALELYGHKNWAPSFSEDTKNAIMENEAFAQLAANPQAVQMIGQVLQQANQALQQARAQAAQMGQAGMVPDQVPYPVIMQMLGEAGIQAPRVKPAVDGHVPHIIEHGQEAKSEEAQSWPGPVQQLLEMHLAEHQRIQHANQQAPPPKVAAALRGDLSPDQVDLLLGQQPGQALRPPQQSQGSGLLHAPSSVHQSTHITGGAEHQNHEAQLHEMHGQAQGG